MISIYEGVTFNLNILSVNHNLFSNSQLAFSTQMHVLAIVIIRKSFTLVSGKKS